MHHVRPTCHRQCRTLLRYSEMTALHLRFRPSYKAHHLQQTRLLQAITRWPAWIHLALHSRLLPEWALVHHVLPRSVDRVMPFTTHLNSKVTHDCHGCLLPHSMYTHVVIRLHKSVRKQREMIFESSSSFVMASLEVRA